MNTDSWKHDLSIGATRLRTGLAACLFQDDTPFAGADSPAPEQTRADVVFFALFGVLVSALGVWVLYLQSALTRAGIF